MSEKTAHLQEALVDEARQKQESARQAEETDLEDSEKMVRYRKEGQISVYNYGPSIRYMHTRNKIRGIITNPTWIGSISYSIFSLIAKLSAIDVSVLFRQKRRDGLIEIEPKFHSYFVLNSFRRILR